MKVKCISNKIWDLLHSLDSNLTDMMTQMAPFYSLKCDNDERKRIDANRFRELTIDEKRKLKLEELGI